MHKLYIAIALIMVVTGLPNTSTSETFTETEIALATDYAMSGLYWQSKEILIPLLHDTLETNLDSRIRYILGSICFMEEKHYRCAHYHWQRVLSEMPNAPEAETIRDIMRAQSFFIDSLHQGVYEDLAFSDELSIERRFWSYKAPDWKMNWRDLEDPELALQYLDMLLKKYPDGRKRDILLLDKFLLLMGFNHQNYGYTCTRGRTRDEQGEQRESFLRQCTAISDSLGAVPEAQPYYVQTRFLLGVVHSGTKFLSSKINLKDEAIPYFEDVVRATEGQFTNPYHIFASIWLKKYYADHPDRR